MKILKKLLATSYVCFYSLSVFSQQVDPVFNIPSPNSQSLQVFGDFPQSSYTGVPPINVPLYTLNYGGVSVPITLSYNSNLVKPDSHPGWVGLGWNLSAGGAITRVVNGAPDDMVSYSEFDSSTTGDNSVGLFYHFSDLAGTGWDSYSNMQYLTNDWFRAYQNDSDYWTSVSDPHTVGDYEPDEFSFNFLGYSGKFYLDETGNWKVRSDQNFTVQVSSTMTQCTVAAHPHMDAMPGFSQFTITDNKGIKYVFGGNSSAIEYSNALFTKDIVPYVAKTWNLTQIILPNQQTITFTYDQGPLIAALFPQVYNTTQMHDPLGQLYNGLSGVEFMGSVIVPSYLKSISTNLETINFYHTTSIELPYSDAKLGYEKSLYITKINNYYGAIQYETSTNLGQKIDLYQQLQMLTDLASLASCQWHKLDRIDVTDASNNVNNRFDFNYTNSTTERLKLLQITKSSPVGGQPNGGVYQFNYNTTQMLPEYFSLKTDFWNNYNGKAPDFSSNANFNLSRAPDPTYETAEVLNKIIYPTAGSTKYDFEPNYYSKIVNNPAFSPLTVLTSDNISGGLRIKTITNYDLNGQMTDYNNYYYDAGHFNSSGSHLSSGVQNSLANFVAFSYNSSNTGPVNVAYFVPSFPGSRIDQGGDIGYSEVTQQYADGSFAIRKFSNFDNGNNGEYMDTDVAAEMSNGAYLSAGAPQLSYHAFISHSFERGKLLQQTVYTSPMATVPLSDHIFSYQRLITPQNNFVRAISPAFRINVSAYNDITNQPGNPPWGEIYNSFAYEFLTYPYLLSSETTLTYQNSASPISKNVVYNYDVNTLNCTSIVTSNSKAQTDETDLIYPTDMFNLGQDPTQVYTAMGSAHITAPVIQTIHKINGVQQTVNSYNYYNPFPGIFVPASKSIQVQANATQQVNQYLNYDDLGNLLCEAKPAGENISYQWGYQNQFPIAKVENASNTLHSVIQSNGNASGYITLPVGSSQAYSQQMNVFLDGTPLTVTLGFTGIPNSNTIASANISISGAGYSNYFTLCTATSSSNCSNSNSQTIYGLPQGVYTISASYNFAQNLSADTRVSFTYPSFITASTGVKEFYYNGFEDDPAGIAGSAHTGLKYSTNNTVAWTPPTNGRTYKISYWYQQGGTWRYSGEQNYTGSTASPYTLTGGTVFDDIRIYPKDALMTTYTYDPLAGITSSTDPKGQTTYYEYDIFQRLVNIKDQYGNIVKSFCYSYAGQSTNCFVPTAKTLIYSNAEHHQIFTTACSNGYTGDNVQYTVPPGKYTSTSQTDADNQALADIQANGQNYANANGSCTLNINITLSNATTSGYQVNFSNDTYNQTFTLLNPGNSTIAVPLGTYSVNIYPTGTYTLHTITCGTQSVSNMPRYNFSNVAVSAGGNLTVSIN